ncbi:DUF721 domain-containing protein [Alkalinema sp. FACHB-956]|uniref:DUF721 domain-containing protein n=1 Tax=Alkalinema sp. FACHB-956 TaxID=2692768 RepID=UPI001686406C|nr:DUF721 domain-containing protein [Alkalinema sp. FACHB-956]MBD2329443.1 DUF721 domain-containing protein [Alkalinema sp. FACHB-956]
MAWQSLGKVLPQLHIPSPSIEQQNLDRIQTQWAAVVGATIAQHTRPVNLAQGILQVATVNSVWVQNLMFQQTALLAKLNQTLELQLVKIRFSTAQWFTQTDPPADPDPMLSSAQTWKQHPSLDPTIAGQYQLSLIYNTPETSFQQWATQVQARSQHWPTCPICQCPTPSGELDRWGSCSICMTKCQP